MSFPNEEDVVRSTSPIPIVNNDEIVVNGMRGILMNVEEIENWRGIIPINQYRVNVDDNPEIINKPSRKPIKYIKNVTIKYLKPPTPQPHGDLIIRQEPDLPVQPAPPVIIRHVEPRPPTPETITIRERPPTPPEILPQQIITVPGKRADPPERRLIIERVPQMEVKDDQIVIEKWLPYEKPKRRIVHQGPSCLARPKPRNLIIQWHFPNRENETDLHYLDPIRADPIDYIRTFGQCLRETRDLPNYEYFPRDRRLLCGDNDDDNDSLPYRLEGDLHALHLLDPVVLERLGLSSHVSIRNQPAPPLPVTIPPVLPINSGMMSVELRRSSINGEFGVVIRGGSEFNIGLFVLRIVDCGVAQRDGRLRAGDEIIQINGQNTNSMRLIDAVELIRSRDLVSFLVRRTGAPPPSITDIVDAMRNGLQI